ncbi:MULTISPECIES: DMT family transporter [Clostridium]|uniref:Multidrug efflux SMR transporter n=1 Tax=Clostridium frigoriphilum TaxID=443253 RepID=A0ABU7US28_9CLOT|nr:multidrug efflux SMR transporter [Clostridium sp. DSM 17811]
MINVVSKNVSKQNSKLAWLYLVVGGLLEICFTFGLKYSCGFTRIFPSIVVIITMLLSFYFLTSAMKVIPVGTAYAVYTGIGSVGTVTVGMMFFGDDVSIMKILFIGLLVGSIMGLKSVSIESKGGISKETKNEKTVIGQSNNIKDEKATIKKVER